MIHFTVTQNIALVILGRYLKDSELAFYDSVFRYQSRTELVV